MQYSNKTNIKIGHPTGGGESVIELNVNHISIYDTLFLMIIYLTIYIMTTFSIVDRQCKSKINKIKKTSKKTTNFINHNIILY